MGSEPPAARYPLADDVAHICVHTKTENQQKHAFAKEIVGELFLGNR